MYKTIKNLNNLKTMCVYFMWDNILMFAFVVDFSVGCAAPNIEGQISLYDHENDFRQSPTYIIIIFPGDVFWIILDEGLSGGPSLICMRPSNCIGPRIAGSGVFVLVRDSVFLRLSFRTESPNLPPGDWESFLETRTLPLSFTDGISLSYWHGDSPPWRERV